MKKKGKAIEADKVIGANIKKYRISRNLSQKDLAGELGMSFQQIQKYEAGVNRVSASVLGKISNHLKVSITRFFNDEDYYYDHDYEQKLSVMMDGVDDKELFKLLERVSRSLVTKK